MARQINHYYLWTDTQTPFHRNRNGAQVGSRGGCWLGTGVQHMSQGEGEGEGEGDGRLGYLGRCWRRRSGARVRGQGRGPGWGGGWA